MYKIRRENRNEECQNNNHNNKNCDLVGESSLEQYADGDLRCLPQLPVKFALGNRYCRCGSTRSVYPYEFDLLSPTNVSNFIQGRGGGSNGSGSCGGGGGCAMNNSSGGGGISCRFTQNDIFNVDKNAIFLTKKSLMLNQFLEYTTNSSTSSSSAAAVAVAIDAKNVKAESTSKHWLKESPFRCGRYTPKNCKGNRTGGGGGPSNSSDETSCRSSVFAIATAAGCSGSRTSGRGGGISSHNRGGGGGGGRSVVAANTICATSSTCSSLLSDKHFVSLLRGITLYWFICLHTVLARGEILKNKKSAAAALAFGECGDIDASTLTMLDAISSATSSSTTATAASFPLSCGSAALQVSLSLLESAHCDLEGDILWTLFRDTIVKENQTATRSSGAAVTPLDYHSRKYLTQNFLRSLLKTLINMWRQSTGIMDIPASYASGAVATTSTLLKIETLKANDGSGDFVKAEDADDNDEDSVELIQLDNGLTDIYHCAKGASKNETFCAELEKMCVKDMAFPSSFGIADLNESVISNNSLSTSPDYVSVTLPNIDNSFPSTSCSSLPSSVDDTGATTTSTTATSLTDFCDNCSWSSSISSCADDDSESTAYPDSDFNSDGCWSSRSDDDDGETESEDDNDDSEDDKDEDDDEEEEDGEFTFEDNEGGLPSNSAPSSECDDCELMHLTDATLAGHDLQFYLPPGIFNCSERPNEYPPYNLWRASFNPMHMLAARIKPDKLTEMATIANATTSMTSVVAPDTTIDAELPNPTATTMAIEEDNFTPYRMWDSPAVITIGLPNVDENGNFTKADSENLTNVVVVAATTNQDDVAISSQQNSSSWLTLHQQQQRLPQNTNLLQSTATDVNSASIYSLWGSQKMVDFQQLSASNTSIVNYDNGSTGATTTTAPTSVGDCCSHFFASCTSSTPLTELIDEPYAWLDMHFREAFAAGFRGGGSSSKFSHYRPSTNCKPVLFTDRGAFQYYRKCIDSTLQLPNTSSLPPIDVTAKLQPIATDACLSVSTTPSLPQKNSNEKNKVAVTATELEITGVDNADNGSIAGVIDVGAGVGDTGVDSAVSNEDDDEDEAGELENLDEATRQALNASYIFRPIQPAFKVPTDVPPLMARSTSGAFYQNGRKLLVFEHELDGGSSASKDDPYLFRPKYAVLPNNKACQTEPMNPQGYEIGFQTTATCPYSCQSPYHSELPNTFLMSRQYTHFGAPVGQQQLFQLPPTWSTPPPQHSWLVSSQPLSTPHVWSICTQPMSPSQLWSVAAPPSSLESRQPLYYSLEDVFNHLGQPGFANVDECEVNRFL